mmetsp:Transcript_10540/g.19726  ORF Transcript_10540/g.19726 Transcript_10540/m.19726 type:complete len:236 (-) Transcript_10540:786-1493(-)
MMEIGIILAKRIIYVNTYASGPGIVNAYFELVFLKYHQWFVSGDAVNNNTTERVTKSVYTLQIPRNILFIKWSIRLSFAGEGFRERASFVSGPAYMTSPKTHFVFRICDPRKRILLKSSGCWVLDPTGVNVPINCRNEFGCSYVYSPDTIDGTTFAKRALKWSVGVLASCISGPTDGSTLVLSSYSSCTVSQAPPPPFPVRAFTRDVFSIIAFVINDGTSFIFKFVSPSILDVST